MTLVIKETHLNISVENIVSNEIPTEIVDRNNVGLWVIPFFYT